MNEEIKEDNKTNKRSSKNMLLVVKLDPNDPQNQRAKTFTAPKNLRE